MRLAVKIAAVLAALLALAQVLARRRSVGDETADEFVIVVRVGGVERACRATALRRGAVSVVLGGVDLDLRDAVLDPAGATLALSAIWGGVNVTVPTTWKVLVERQAVLGGVDANVTPAEELPDDAPVLRVEATARFGGVAIKAKDAAEAWSPAAQDLPSSAST